MGREVWIDEDLDDFDDDELIKELQSRDYIVYRKGHAPGIIDDLQKLYDTYKTMPHDFFMKELKKHFRDVLDVNEY